MPDEDLAYDGRARKRPPGANSTVIDIFDLLDENPDGLTLDEICLRLRAGFPTDAYRAYDETRKRAREREAKARALQGGSPARVPWPRPMEYGTQDFERAAERWWVRSTLRHMLDYGTARRENDRLYRGQRAPSVRIVCEAGVQHLVPYDSKKGREEDAARVKRAHLREAAREVLADKRLSGKARKVIEALLELT